MNICFCINNLGALGLGTTLTSLIKNCSDTAKLRLYFLCASVDNNIKNAITRLLAETNFKGQFEFIDFDPYTQFGKYRSLQNDWTTYGRLLIPDLLDEKEALYLDSDLIIETDVLELYAINLKDFVIGAVPSTPIQYALEHNFFIQVLKIAPHLKVFNAGILLINMEAWEKNNIKSKLLAIGDQYPQELLSADQALLNALFVGDFFNLPSKYNRYWYPGKKPAIENDAIFHFVGSPKPWDFFGKYLHSGYQKWQQYNTVTWRKNVLNKHKGQQLQRFWAIRKSYVKALLKK